MYKIMALDIGTKRIGVALSDYLLMLSNGHSCVPRLPEDKVPFNMDGTQGAQAQDCKDFAAKIQGYEIIYEDERLTSDTAEENLRAKKIDFRKKKGNYNYGR